MKSFTKALVLSLGLTLALTPLSLSAALPGKLLGAPQRVSPIPGPANPDPVLQNLEAVMDNFFIPPWYPGGAPDYLSQIRYFSDNYNGGRIIFNPLDDRIGLIPIGQNLIIDDTFTLVNMVATNTIGHTFDGGYSFVYGPPVEQTIPLGGTISQLINSSAGPGLGFRYTKCGRLYASGQGFDDTRPNPPFQIPYTGFLFATSDDNGQTWTKPNVILREEVNWWFYNATGWGWWDFYIAPDPVNPDIIYGNATRWLFPDTYFANLFELHSEDAGKTWSNPVQNYSMVTDPVWMAENFSEAYANDPSLNPAYLTTGGQSIHSAAPLVYDENTILMPILRLYPHKDSPIYTTYPPDSACDQAIVISEDKGKTWSPVAGHTDKFIFQNFPFDPAYLDPFDGSIGDSGGQSCSPIISPFTGRLYLTYEVGNPAADPDEFIAQNYFQILLSASSDKGKTFGPAVQINRTPTDISFRRQQAFAHDAIMTDNGYYIVGYYDFRNWTGVIGEDVDTTPLQTDCWLDIYKEVDDPHGGSTGVGLDFVQEIRLTPQSFNARYGTQATGSATGTNEGMHLTLNNGNVVHAIYSTTNEPDPAKITVGYKGMTIDTNSTYNILMQRIKFARPSNQ